ncbi:MAG: AAA family ATPase [Cyanobacteria bacterium SZAS LIN-5]|nr:AAA family ATPase [Cyanobacteria bacterium SZAS LIN-5]
MWIERIDFAGYGNISGEKIEFKDNKLNLVVESNEYGKSTIASAVWAILYDFPESGEQPSEREARRPSAASKMPYIASIDITTNGTRLKVIRDFSDGAVQVVDRDQKNKDVTKRFRGPNGEDQVGLKLTGMTREMFRSTCFVGQRELDEHAFSGDSDLTSLFQGIADSSQPASNASNAIEILEDALHHFPHKGKRNRVEVVMRDLEGQYYELSDKIKKLESDKDQIGVNISKIGKLEGDIVDDTEQAGANEYFELCLEAADTDNRLIQAQTTLAKLSELRQEMSSLGNMDGFPIDSVKRVEELWTRRQSRQEDYDRYLEEMAPQLREYESHEKHAQDRFDGLSEFSADEGKRIGVLAVTFYNLQAELHDLRQRRGDRDPDVGSGAKPAAPAQQSLDEMEHENARSYVALIDSFKEAIADAESKIDKNRMFIFDVEEQKKTKKVMFVLPGASKKKEVELAEAEIEKCRKQVDELSTKIRGLEGRLDALAQKIGLASGKHLVAQLTGAPMPVNKEAEARASLDNLIIDRETTLAQVKADLEPFFVKAGRQAWEINSDSATELADQIGKYIEEQRHISSTYSAVKQSKQQLEFLASEIQNIDDQLREIFVNAHLEDSDNIADVHQQFFSKLASFHRWQVMHTELRKMETDMSSGFTPDELPPQVERLETMRMEIFARMQELVEQYPNIAEMAPPMTPPRRMNLSGGYSSKMYLDDLRRERDELTLAVRTASMNHDQNYLAAVEELEQVSRELNNVRRAKTAIELARDTLQRLSAETYEDWSVKLNEIAKEMITNIGLDFDHLHFDSDLRITARKKSDGQEVNASNISTQLSTGTKEQLHWLARMVVSRFLSKGNPLPIVLDEPFSEADDERFLRVMQFLLDVLVANHQVVIFSCHQQRHHWLISQLTPEQTAKIDFARRTPLRG